MPSVRSSSWQRFIRAERARANAEAAPSGVSSSTSRSNTWSVRGLWPSRAKPFANNSVRACTRSAMARMPFGPW